MQFSLNILSISSLRLDIRIFYDERVFLFFSEPDGENALFDSVVEKYAEACKNVAVDSKVNCVDLYTEIKAEKVVHVILTFYVNLYFN